MTLNLGENIVEVIAPDLPVFDVVPPEPPTFTSSLSSTGSRKDRLQWSMFGVVEAKVGRSKIYNDSGQNWLIRSVRISLGVAGTTDTVADIHTGSGTGDGVSLWTTQANRPRLISGDDTDLNTDMDIVTIPPGNWLKTDVDNAGIGAEDLLVQVEIE